MKLNHILQGKTEILKRIINHEKNRIKTKILIEINPHKRVNYSKCSMEA